MRVISAHFTAEENACHCGCDKATADVELVWLLELIRRVFGGRAVSVHSWYRCEDHNRRPTSEFSATGVRGVGSMKGSWHEIGGAADISIRGVMPVEIRDFIRERFPDKYGVGVYDTFVHVDVRQKAGNWDERTGTRYA